VKAQPRRVNAGLQSDAIPRVIGVAALSLRCIPRHIQVAGLTQRPLGGLLENGVAESDCEHLRHAGLVAVLALSIAPPFLAVILVIAAEYAWAFTAVAVWLIWLRFGGPVRRFVFEGFEHGSI